MDLGPKAGVNELGGLIPPEIPFGDHDTLRAASFSGSQWVIRKTARATDRTLHPVRACWYQFRS